MFLKLAHQLYRIAREEVSARRNWMRVLAASPTNTSIAWNARLIGSGIRLEDGVRIHGGALLQAGSNPQEHIHLGYGCSVWPQAQLYSWGGFIELGQRCTVHADTVLYGTGGIRIGNYVRIAAHTSIVAAEHRFGELGRPITEQGYTAKGIVIEDDVWIGAGCRILDGVRIGRGAVIGAGSVVNRDVEAGDVVVGVPARAIRNRALSAAPGP